MLTEILLIAVGFALVAKGGDLFVDSSLQIGRALRIPRFVIGGTLVSLATTAPELVVSVTAASLGDSGIALGNAVGSCICNIGLIVGTVALIMPVEVDRSDFIRRAGWMVAGGVLVVAFSWDRSMERVYGGLLLAGAAAYLIWDLAGILRARRRADPEAADRAAADGLGGAVGWFAVGGVCVVLGSRLLVTAGQGLAVALGVPSAIIGFSIIAIGTSLPELVTGVTAARKGVPDLSLGNIVGANVLNLFLGDDPAARARPLQPALWIPVARDFFRGVRRRGAEGRARPPRGRRRPARALRALHHRSRLVAGPFLSGRPRFR